MGRVSQYPSVNQRMHAMKSAWIEPKKEVEDAVISEKGGNGAKYGSRVTEEYIV